MVRLKWDRLYVLDTILFKESLKLVSEVKTPHLHTYRPKKKTTIRRKRVILFMADSWLHLCRQLSLT